MWLWLYHFGAFGAPPILAYFGGDWDVHWGYGLLTHGHVFFLKGAPKVDTDQGGANPQSKQNHV